jgi:hypothetical protein
MNNYNKLNVSMSPIDYLNIIIYSARELYKRMNMMNCIVSRRRAGRQCLSGVAE